MAANVYVLERVYAECRRAIAWKGTLMSEKRAWVITALWFGAIALLGLVKRGLERQKSA